MPYNIDYMSHEHDSLVVYTDGGSRGNPGHAGVGVVIYSISDEENPLHTIKKYLGNNVTNNEAEYAGVIVALEYIEQHFSPHKIQFFLDSELVVKQLKGEYKVKNQGLKVKYNEILLLSKGIPVLQFNHVPRSQNAFADRLVNEALDAHLGL